jgi:hypothetical protein
MFDLPTKALSIRQPWAWAIINAGKDIENRDWATKFRGPVCIHAAKKWGVEERLDIDCIHRLSGVRFPIGQPNLGGIVGIAEIVDCVDMSESPWFFGPYGFVLRNVQPVEFIPVKGALGFFDWRKNLEGGNHA